MYGIWKDSALDPKISIVPPYTGIRVVLAETGAAKVTENVADDPAGTVTVLAENWAVAVESSPVSIGGGFPATQLAFEKVSNVKPGTWDI